MEHIKDKNIKLIKDSFESTNSKAPEFIWENLDKQLYVDRVWMKLKIKLDKIQTFKIRIRFFLYSAGIILLLIFTGSYYFMHEQYLVNNFVSKDTKLKTLFTHNNHQDAKAYYKATTLEKVISEKKPKVKNSVFIIQKTKQSKVIDTLNNTPIANIYQNNLTIGNTSQFYSELSMVSKQIINDSLFYIEPKEVETLGISKDDQYSQINLPEFSFDTTKQYDNYYLAKNELGLIYSLNSTMLINNDFIESKREGSMVNVLPTVASSYGLIYNHTFSKSNVLSFEFYFLSNQNQHAHIYSNGKYYKKNIELDYSKAVISYQRDIRLFSMKPSSWFFVKAGGYFSILTKNNIYYVRNDEITDMPTSMISKNDYGIKLSIGREKETKFFIIGGGLQSEYGLKNIFKGDEYTPSDFNRTNNFSHGFFMTLKFKY